MKKNKKYLNEELNILRLIMDIYIVNMKKYLSEIKDY